jgi:hypothetical protein
MQMNMAGTGMTGVGVSSLTFAGTIGLMWALLFATMLIALGISLSHFLPRRIR